MEQYTSVTRFIKPGCLLALAWLCAGGAIPAQAAELQEFQLANGLKVIVLVDRRAPIVVSQVWYKVGSSYEHDGITGVSHALEHMMFKGTQTLEPGEFSQIIARHGGRENAFTGRHYTAYFQRIHRDQLALCLRLEADRMRGLRLQAEEFDKEREVIKEERLNRTDDRPASATYEQFNATAYVTSPNRHPIIGWMQDIGAMTVEDLRAWYDTWYAPNNATLMVAGDVDPHEVRALAEQYFGVHAPRTVPSPKPRKEIPQRGTRRIELRLPATLPLVVLGYKVPSLLQAESPRDAYALEMLAAILSGGDSSRLSDGLVRTRQLAVSAAAGYELYDRYQTLLTLNATPANGRSVTEVEDALRAEVRRLRDEPVTAAELRRIKTQVVAAKTYERDSLFYQAMQIGIAETVGVGREAYEGYLQAMQEVSAEDVQRVARQYLVDEVLTIGVLEPDGV